MNRVLLDNVDHHDVTVAMRAGAEWGDSVNQMPLFPTEFEEAQRDFPIIFRRTQAGDIQPFVLLGLDRDENLFLGPDGWTTRYIPAVQRRGPFSIALAPGDEPMIQIDLDDPRVGAADGFRLFREHGGNTAYLDYVTVALSVIHDGRRTVAAQCGELDAAGLLRAATLHIDLDDDHGYDLPDVLTVDADALARLGGAVLERLHRDGLLRIATLAAASLGNIQRLVDRKNRQLGMA